MADIDEEIGLQNLIDAFNEWQRSFDLPDVPPGTPNRRQLQKQRLEADRIRRTQPDYKADADKWWKLIQLARRRVKAKHAAMVRLSRPDHQERQRVFRALRMLGFSRESTSGRSAYYRRGGLVVRVSNHDVPMTDERCWNLDNGGRSWANSRWSFVVGRDDLDEWLAEIQDEIDREES